MRKLADWSTLDWRKSNAVLAQELGASMSVVAKRRTQHGHPADYVPRVRPNLAAANRRPERRRQTAALQPLATAAAKQSAAAGRGVLNVRAIDWVLIDPSGERHHIRNLYEFVRANLHLFADADVLWKRTGGKRGEGGEWCNATAGILNIKGGRAKTWKGWTLDHRQ